MRRIADPVVDGDGEGVGAGDGSVRRGIGEIALSVDTDGAVARLRGDDIREIRVVVVDGVEAAGDGSVGTSTGDRRSRVGPLVVPRVLDVADEQPQRLHQHRHRCCRNR